ncbi:MAG: phosphoserine phosphatase SerB [Rhodospirillales bacterium]
MRAMSSVLTLVGDPAARDLTANQIEAVRDALSAAGARLGETDWLALQLAVDLHFSGLDEGAAMRAARAALGAAPVDLAAQALQDRRKKVLVADMDSTVITSETLDDMADHAGLAEEVSAITRQTMNGELPFEESLRQRVAMLRDLPLQALNDVVAGVTLTAGARSMVRSLRAQGCYTVLCSGGFTFCTGPVAELCGFHEHHANVLLHAEGRLTGKVSEPILGRDAKVERLNRVLKERRLKPQEAAAIGDGANDIALLGAVGLGVAFRGKPAVREAASYHIDHGDLTAMLFFQGLRETELIF